MYNLTEIIFAFSHHELIDVNESPKPKELQCCGMWCALLCNVARVHVCALLPTDVDLNLDCVRDIGTCS